LKVLIVGINSYLGSAIAKKLYLAGHSIEGVDRQAEIMFDPLKGETVVSNFFWDISNFRYYRIADIEDLTAVIWAKTVDKVIYCAGIVGYKNCIDNNALTTLINSRVPMLLAKIFERKFIYLSAQSIFGSNYDENKLHCMTEDTHIDPKSEYAKSKRLGEVGVIDNGGSVLRLATVFGDSPLIKMEQMVHNWVVTLLKTATLSLFQVETYRSLLYMDDLTNYIANNLVDNNQPRVINLTTLYLTKFAIAKSIVDSIHNYKLKASLSNEIRTTLTKEIQIITTIGNDPEARYNPVISKYRSVEHDPSNFLGKKLEYLIPKIVHYLEENN